MLRFFRHFSTLPALKTLLVLSLGLALVLSSGWWRWDSAGAAVGLVYTRGHFWQPWAALAVGVLLLAGGIKRLLK